MMDKGVLFAIFLLLLPTIVYAQTENGLIGYWRFDGNGNNSIVGGPNATLVGNAVFNSDSGKLGGYLYIPTTSDYAKIPYNSAFDLPTSWTIEFWFRQRSNQSALQNLIYKGTPINNYNFYIYRQLWNQYNFGPVIVGYTAVNTGYWSQTSNPNQRSHGEWHHVAYTRYSNGAAYYLDGILTHYLNLTQYPEYSGSAKTPASDIIIGDSAIDTDIDNLRIYNRALSFTEVLENGGFPTTCPTCSSATEWGACNYNYQYRTNYKCDVSTSYQCQSYSESQSCVSSNQTSSNQTTTNQTTSNQTATNQTASNQTSSNQTTTNQTSSGTTASNITSNQTATNETVSNQTTSNIVTCSSQSAVICEAGETCSASWLEVNDTTRCCSGACIAAEQGEAPVSSASAESEAPIESTSIESPEPIECNGCTYQLSCLPYGTRLTQNDNAVYCDISKVLETQKADDQSCQNNYECLNNYCIDGTCKNLQKQLEEERTVVKVLIEYINKIFNFFGKFFGKKST